MHREGPTAVFAPAPPTVPRPDQQLHPHPSPLDSGFNHVEEEKVEPRLLHCKGKMHIVVRQVPITYKSLNSGDSFIYEDNECVYIWHGKDAGAMEKAKAANIAQAMADEQGKKRDRAVFAEDHGHDKEWWHAVGGKVRRGRRRRRVVLVLLHRVSLSCMPSHAPPPSSPAGKNYVRRGGWQR